MPLTPASIPLQTKPEQSSLNMEFVESSIHSLPLFLRVLVFVSFAVVVHLLVRLIKRGSVGLLSHKSYRSQRKFQSVVTLSTSAIVFSLYFFALGLMLRELGVSLTAYLASASVIGLAVDFGSQGLVQDVVNGLTFIFSDLVDVGDLVEISCQTGIVKSITMRFVQMENALGARVFIPNRTINNVINYPSGYIRCLVDMILIGDEAERLRMLETTERQMHAVVEELPGILMSHSELGERQKLKSGKEFVRVNFRIWPNRGDPIERIFCQELSAALKSIDSEYQNWMIMVNYEVGNRVSTRKSGLIW